MEVGALIQALDGLANRKGVVYMVLLTQVLAVGPMEVFVANNALYMTLPFSKLLLLSVGLTLPPLVAGIAIFLMMRRAEPLDRLAVLGIVTTSGAVTFCGVVGITYTWIQGGGFQPYVLCVGFGLVLILLLKYGEKRKWERDIEEGRIAFEEGDMFDFAMSRREEFFEWKRTRDAQAKTEKLVDAP